MNIYLLTGPVQSGKTTMLVEFCKTHKSIAGILSPDIDGVRHLIDIESGDKKVMEAASNEAQTLCIGRYIFSKAAIEWASNILLNISPQKYKLVIVDEVGPLELQNNGFSNAIRSLLLQDNLTNLLIVVREQIIEKVIVHFDLINLNVKIIDHPEQLTVSLMDD